MDVLDQFALLWFSYIPNKHRHPDLCENSNFRPIIIDTYPNIPWWDNSYQLSKNPHITFAFIQKHIDKPWEWDLLSENANITWNDVINNNHLPWNYKEMSKNTCITMDIVQKNSHLPWDYKNLSENPSITWNDIIQHKDKPWCWYSIGACHPKITLDMITPYSDSIAYEKYKELIKGVFCEFSIQKGYVDRYERRIIQSCITKKEVFLLLDDITKVHSYHYCHYKTLHKNLSKHQNITIDIADEYIQKQKEQNKGVWRPISWNWSSFSKNPNITWDIVLQYWKYPWNWKSLSKHPNITWDIVQQNPNKPWNWKSLSKNRNITWAVVEQNPDKPWHWGSLIKNPNITWDIIKNNFDKPWNWRELSLHTSITFKNVEESIDKPWRWPLLSSNPSLTIEILRKYHDKPWDWNRVSTNTNIRWKNVADNLDLPWNYMCIHCRCENDENFYDFYFTNIDLKEKFKLFDINTKKWKDYYISLHFLKKAFDVNNVNIVPDIARYFLNDLS